MTPYQKRMNQYIERMAGDMRIRNFANATIDAYTFHVDKFCQYFGKTADELGPEQIREYQLYLVNEKKASWSSFNQAVCGLRFLYQVTLQKPWTIRHIPFGKRPKKLPVVLSNEEATSLLECVENPKHRAVLMTCYAAGLRLTEATHLKIQHIDGQRQQLHIMAGKGAKDRLVPASPRLLEELREYWKIGRPANYLFPGKTPDVPLSSATIQKAMKLGLAQAGIKKAASPHTLRHSWATSMLEAGVDLLTISKILGHASFVTTMVYLHVRRQHFDRTPSPIDWLPVRQCPKWAEASTTDQVVSTNPVTPDPTVTTTSPVTEPVIEPQPEPNIDPAEEKQTTETPDERQPQTSQPQERQSQTKKPRSKKKRKSSE